MLPNDICVLQLSSVESRYTKTKEMHIPGRRFHALTMRLSGEKRLRTGACPLFSGPGCVTYIPQGVDYFSQCLLPGEMIVISFTLAPPLPDAGLWVLRPNSPERTERQFRLLAEHFRHGHGDGFAAKSLFYALLEDLERQESSLGGTVPECMQRAARRLEQEIGNPDYSISSLASELAISEAWLRREFSRAFGASPLAWLKRKRLERACELLRSGYYPVHLAAEACGYRSPGYFAAEFRKAYGRPPSGFLRYD